MTATKEKQYDIHEILEAIARTERLQAKYLEESEMRRKEDAKREKDTERQMALLRKQMGDISRRFGEMAEYMVAPNLSQRMYEYGYNYTKLSQEVQIEDENRNFLLEIDILLENGDTAMLVEVKTKPNIDDIKEHIERLQKYRLYSDKRNDKRRFLGGVAGVVFPKNVKEFALKSGFFVIEPSGETFIITKPEGRDSLKEW
jgi:predicted AAA+ superfamily ATPase